MSLFPFFVAAQLSSRLRARRSAPEVQRGDHVLAQLVFVREQDLFDSRTVSTHAHNTYKKRVCKKRT